jgi:hypothetical protein
MSEASMPQLLEHFNDLLTHLRQTNPIVQQFQTMMERNLGVVDHEVPNGCPILPSTTLDNTVAAAQVCGIAVGEHRCHACARIILLSAT